MDFLLTFALWAIITLYLIVGIATSAVERYEDNHEAIADIERRRGKPLPWAFLVYVILFYPEWINKQKKSKG
jgi:hypothetical protein